MARSSGRRALGALLRTAWRADRGGVATVFALNIAAPLSWLGSMVGIKLLFDAAAGRNVARALVAAFLIVVVGQSTHFFGLRQWGRAVKVTARTAQALDEELMTISGGLPGIEHHERPEYADRIAVVRQERRRIGFAAYVVALDTRIALQLGGSVFLLARLHPLLVLLPVLAVVSFASQTRAARIVDEAVEATAGQTRQRQELFDLLTAAPAGKELRVFGLRDELLGRHRAVAEAIDGRLTTATLRSALLRIVGLATFALSYAIAIALVLAGALAGHRTVGDVALAVTLAAAINSQVAYAAEELAFLRRMIGIGKHYVWLHDYADAAGRPVADPAPVPDRLAREIRFDNVSFRYPGTEALVLDGVSFTVPTGATVALVGENGSGKTTLAKLLLRMYEPVAGGITVDGVDIASFDVPSYRRRVCAAFQDYCRFELLARETVGVGDLDRIDDEAAVLAAIGRAAAEDVLAGLEAGLDTQLGRAWEGVDLSGGQWQKLAVARGLMREGPLVLAFDEPTAALDPFSEHLLFERVAARRGTTLLVSHRFSTVRMADRIVVLEHGRVIETGTHDELVALGGLYAELYELQSSSYR